jgi:hypothetical protein
MKKHLERIEEMIERTGNLLHGQQRLLGHRIILYSVSNKRDVTGASYVRCARRANRLQISIKESMNRLPPPSEPESRSERLVHGKEAVQRAQI